MSKDGGLACLETGAIKLPGGCVQDSIGSKGTLSLKEPSSEVNIAPGRPGLGGGAWAACRCRDPAWMYLVIPSWEDDGKSRLSGRNISLVFSLLKLYTPAQVDM